MSPTDTTGIYLSLLQLVEAVDHKLSREPCSAQIPLKDEEIDALEKRLLIILARLRGYRNSLQPIHKLAPELLVTIFDQIRPHYTDFLPCVPRPQAEIEHNAWLSLLHVCRHWRGLIASSPTLWSTVITWFKDPLQFLRRSRGAPLSVIFGRELHQSLLRSVLKEASRIREFHLYPRLYEGKKPIFDMLSSSMPCLQSLSIHGLLMGHGGITDGALPVIFGGVMPELKKLCLSHFTSWPSGYFTDLTHLFLHDQDAATRPTTADFITFLESCPRLEELGLVRAGPTRDSSTDVPVSSSHFVELPQLRRLEIGGWASLHTASRFLSHLILPSTTSFSLWDNLDVMLMSENFGVFFSAVSETRLKFLSTIRSWVLLSGARRVNTANGLELSFLTVENGILQMCGPFSPSQLAPITSQFPGLSQIRNFTIIGIYPDSEASISPSMLEDLFEHLPRLKSLQMCGTTCSVLHRAILSVLQSRNETDADAEEKPLLVPRLRRLAVHGKPDRIPHLEIAAVARDRHRLGKPLKKLQISIWQSPTPPSQLLIIPPSTSTRSLLILPPGLSGTPDVEPEDDEVVIQDMSVLQDYVEKVQFAIRKDTDGPPPESRSLALPSVFESSMLRWAGSSMWTD